MNVPSWRGGRGDVRVPQGWRCGPELCWQPLMAGDEHGALPTRPGVTLAIGTVRRWRNGFAELASGRVGVPMSLRGRAGRVRAPAMTGSRRT